MLFCQFPTTSPRLVTPLDLLTTAPTSVRTSVITVYDTADSWPVSAGVGQFNQSLVAPFLAGLTSVPGYNYTILPYTYFAAVYVLVANPLVSTTISTARDNCHGKEYCISYLLSGGLEMVAPWVPQGHPEYELVKVEHAPALQLDFAWPAGQDSFDKADCDVFGSDVAKIAVRLCVKEVEAGRPQGLLRAGKSPRSVGIRLQLTRL